MSNTLSMGVLSDSVVKAQAHKAFTDDSKASKLLGSAVQRMAYSLTGYIAGLSGVPTLAQAFGSAEATKNLRERAVSFLLGEPEKFGKDMSDRIAQTKATQNAQIVLVTRGLQLATILAKVNTPLSAFNLDTGVFSVAPALLLDKASGQAPFGRLAQNKPIPLDGKPVTFMTHDKAGNEKYGQANASVAYLVKLHQPPKTRAAGGSQGETAASKIIGGDGVKLVKALAKILGDNAETVPMDNDPKTQEFMNDLRMVKIWTDRQLAAIDNAKNAPAQSGNGNGKSKAAA